MPPPALQKRSSRTAHPLRIRRATEADLAALLELENASFVTDRMRERQLRRHLHSESARLLVAVRARRLAGAAVLFFRSRSRIARLYSIAVAATARGQGVGETLLAAAERTAARRGCERLRLEVRVDNAGAQRLYERRGYFRFGRLSAYYEDGHDAWRYEKRLIAG